MDSVDKLMEKYLFEEKYQFVDDYLKPFIKAGWEAKQTPIKKKNILDYEIKLTKKYEGYVPEVWYIYFDLQSPKRNPQVSNVELYRYDHHRTSKIQERNVNTLESIQKFLLS